MPEHQQPQKSSEPKPTSQKKATQARPSPILNPMAIIQRAKINPKSMTSADILQLQKTIGNRAVGRLLSEIRRPTSAAQQPPIQRQEISEEEETCPSCIQKQEIPEEEEPLQGKFIGTIQRQEIPEEEEPLQGKMADTIQRQEIPEEEEPLQGKFESKPEISCPSFFAAPIVQKQELEEEEKTLQGKMIGTVQRQEIPEEEEPLQAKRENNTGMPDNLKAGVESLSGIDMSDVRVHYNSSKPAEVGALAYTQGTNIHVAPGQERHMPHEAWHVVQQVQGRVRPTMKIQKSILVNDNLDLEHEADGMGEQALQMQISINEVAKVNTQPMKNFGLNALPVQMVNTFTGVPMTVAKSIYKNYAKGDPPFKPQHGRFGRVSWFKGKNSPYLGSQAVNYDVHIDVTTRSDPKHYPDHFTKVLDAWDPEGTKRHNGQLHGDFWRTLGTSLENMGLAEVDIPLGPLNHQEPGTFITASSSAREEITLGNPEKLRDDIKVEASHAIESNLHEQNLAKEKGFKVRIDNLDSSITPTSLISGFIARPTEFKSVVLSENPQTMADKIQKIKTQNIEITLTYQDYLTARKNAKILATAISSKKIAKQGVTIIKGTNWKDSAIRSYTQQYKE